MLTSTVQIFQKIRSIKKFVKQQRYTGDNKDDENDVEENS